MRTGREMREVREEGRGQVRREMEVRLDHNEKVLLKPVESVFSENINGLSLKKVFSQFSAGKINIEVLKQSSSFMSK